MIDYVFEILAQIECIHLNFLNVEKNRLKSHNLNNYLFLENHMQIHNFHN
jgi:hypothetical protein